MEQPESLLQYSQAPATLKLYYRNFILLLTFLIESWISQFNMRDEGKKENCTGFVEFCPSFYWQYVISIYVPEL
jgi:hypothetical protein